MWGRLLSLIFSPWSRETCDCSIRKNGKKPLRSLCEGTFSRFYIHLHGFMYKYYFFVLTTIKTRLRRGTHAKPISCDQRKTTYSFLSATTHTAGTGKIISRSEMEVLSLSLIKRYILRRKRSKKCPAYLST